MGNDSRTGSSTDVETEEGRAPGADASDFFGEAVVAARDDPARLVVSGALEALTTS